jgi:hypothetical protein
MRILPHRIGSAKALRCSLLPASSVDIDIVEAEVGRRPETST